jgi:4-nitrophenyl phosphatase
MSETDFKEWPEQIEGFVLDLDGTLYRGSEPIPGAFEALHLIRESGIPVVFLTNNATRSREQFASKLTGMGFKAEARDIINTAFAAPRLIRESHAAGSAVFVIGARALERSIRKAGFRITDKDPDIVVVGLDRSLTYQKLRTGVRAILAGAAFYATNPDTLIPHGSELDPGAGTIVAAIESATAHVTSPIFIGKPETYMPNMALMLLGSKPENTVAVGDQILTDVSAGKRAGMFSVLVRTGVPLVQTSAIIPDRIIRSLLEIPIPQRSLK